MVARRPQRASASYYAQHFDVDGPSGRPRAPAGLVERYGRAIQSGAFRSSSGATAARSKPAMSSSRCAPRAELGRARASRELNGSDHAELAFIGDSLEAVPRPQHTETDVLPSSSSRPQSSARTAREAARGPAVAVALADEIAAVSNDPAELDALLEMQTYRLAHWSVRRSAVVSPLLRHQHARRGSATSCPTSSRRATRDHPVGARRTLVDGLRIDHIDGLADPSGISRASEPRPTARTSSSRRSSSAAARRRRRRCRRGGRRTARRATTRSPRSIAS